MCDLCSYEYELPPGKKWAFIGKCPCRGADLACSTMDSLWKVVNEEDDWCFGLDGEIVDLR